MDEKVCIVRAPGRINLMGRHVDHRGGMTNFLAIDRETIAVVGLRDDDNVVAVNTQPEKFKPVEFNISELIGRFAWSDWLNFVNSDWVRNMLYVSGRRLGQLHQGRHAPLQHRYQDVPVRGLNMALTGNVPIAAGLSSSSTLVVATLQAAIALNNFDLTSQQFIDLCGEGEWFVGSRGGAGDHAAIYLGQRGKIAHVGYLPFRVEKIIDAPRDYQVVIANSHIKAAKSSAAQDTVQRPHRQLQPGPGPAEAALPGNRRHGRVPPRHRPGEARLHHQRHLPLAARGCPRRMTRQDFRAMLSRGAPRADRDQLRHARRARSTTIRAACCCSASPRSSAAGCASTCSKRARSRSSAS